MRRLRGIATGKRGLRIIPARFHVKQTSNTQHNMGMLQNDYHPSARCSCADCHRQFPDLEHANAEPQKAPFSTNLDWNERAELRVILKAATQLPGFNRDERALAMRLIGELDQMRLEF